MTVDDGVNKSVGSAYRIQLDKESQSGKAHDGLCAAHSGPCAAHRGPWAADRGQVEDFGAKCTDSHCMTTQEICLNIFFESCWAY